MTDTLLYDIAAERALIGVALLYPSAVETMLHTNVSSDFGSPHFAAVYLAIAELHSQGAGIDAITVRDQLRRSGTDWDTASADLVAAMTESPSPGAAARHAEIVWRWAQRRRLAAEGTGLAQAARDVTQDPNDVIDAHRSRLAEIDSPVLERSPGDIELSAFVAEKAEASATVVPGTLAEDDRTLVIAPEGFGKSELLRQMVVAVPFGLHPFTFRPIEPVPTLLVDLENPRQLVRDRLTYLSQLAGANAKCGRAPCTLWHRPGGIDVRKRADRLALEDVLRRNRPKLVCAGPLYKAYSRRASETDEQVASEVQTILDDLRTRYAFALVLEHHAPQASNGFRDLRPMGSSLWLRWPEFGLSLKPDPKRPHQVLQVGRWRGDRYTANWPDELHRGQLWPWEGRWTSGIPSREVRDDPEF